MTDVQPYEGNLAIIVGNGKVLQVTHTGNVNLRTGDELFDLKNTLCVPDFWKNVISIQRLTSNHPIEFTLCSNHFSSKTLMTGTNIEHAPNMHRSGRPVSHYNYLLITPDMH